jgi:hypothetical protein
MPIHIMVKDKSLFFKLLNIILTFLQSWLLFYLVVHLRPVESKQTISTL